MKTRIPSPITYEPSDEIRLYVFQSGSSSVRVDPPVHPQQAEQVLRLEGDVEADEEEPERQLAQPLVEHPAEDLRPPVEERGEERERRAAHQHVVEVRDDEVRVVRLPVERIRATKIPDRPPIVNTTMKPSANSIAVSNWRFPRQVVATQLKIFIPVGMAISIDAIMKKAWSQIGIPDREHVVGPDEHRQEADRDGRERDRLVAEDRLAREDRGAPRR